MESNETIRTDTESESTETKATSRREKICYKHRPNNDNLLLILSIAGSLFGILLGGLVRMVEPSEDVIMIIAFPGELFMRALKMLVVPVIITSIVTGISASDMKGGGLVGRQATLYYMGTTILAVILGIVMVIAIHPGTPINEQQVTETQVKNEISSLDTYFDILRNLVPDNILAACFEGVQTTSEGIIVKHPMKIKQNMSIPESKNISNGTDFQIKKSLKPVRNTNVLGLIAFCILFGITISNIGEEGLPIVQLFNALNTAFMKMLIKVIWISPIGICSMIAAQIMEIDSIGDVGRTVIMYTVTTLICSVIHTMVVLTIIYWIFTRRNALKIAYKLLQTLITALGTGSSLATLPVTLKNMENNIGIDKRVTRLILPIGATINMDATAFLQGVASITIAQMYNTTLTFGQIIVISTTAIAASIGASSIPSSGLVTLLMVLRAANLPPSNVMLFWSVDWILNRIRTVVNVYGDCIGAAIIYYRNKRILDAKGHDDDSKLLEIEKKKNLHLKLDNPSITGREGAD